MHPHRTLPLSIVLLVVTLGFAGAGEAQLASRPAEDWIKALEDPARLAGMKIDEVIARLRLRPGDVVADLGAGAGTFALPLARAVPKGKVYAVELDEAFLSHIRRRLQAEGVTNVQPVLGEPTDPALPASDVDVAFFHDVLHHVEDRVAYLKSVARYVKPNGRIVVIDLHPEQSPHKGQPALLVSKAQAAPWLAAAGFEPVEDVDLFTDKWFVIYRRR